MKRIKITAALVTLIALVIAGCGKNSESSENTRTETNNSISAPNVQQPLLSFDCDSGRARIMECIWDATSKRVALSADLEYSGLAKGRYRIEMQSCQWVNADRGARTSLFDENSDLLFEYTFRWDPTNPTWVSISERTSTDEMTIIRAVRGDSIRETYEINGTSQEFLYSQRILDYWRNLLPADSLTSAELRSADLISATFQSFYEDSNSLHHNKAGELLVGVMTNPKLRGWLDRRPAPHLYNAMQKPNAAALTKEELCLIAAICDKIKCLPVCGGLANPLCIPCAGIDLACLIADTVAWISGWFD